MLVGLIKGNIKDPDRGDKGSGDCNHKIMRDGMGNETGGVMDQRTSRGWIRAA
jgi:hypothetical protein